MKTGGENNLGSVSVRTLTVGVKGGSDITNNDVPYRYRSVHGFTVPVQSASQPAKILGHYSSEWKNQLLAGRADFHSHALSINYR
jgi:hypothetical protein